MLHALRTVVRELNLRLWDADKLKIDTTPEKGWGPSFVPALHKLIWRGETVLVLSQVGERDRKVVRPWVMIHEPPWMIDAGHLYTGPYVEDVKHLYERVLAIVAEHLVDPDTGKRPKSAHERVMIDDIIT